MQNINQKTSRIDKVKEKAINFISNGNVMIIPLIVGFIKSIFK